MEQNADYSTSSTVRRSLKLLDLIQQLTSPTLINLTNEMGNSKSTVLRHLNTLEDCEYVIQSGDRYELSLKLLKLGYYAKSSNITYELAESKVNKLATETGYQAQFVVEQFGQGVYVHQAIGGDSIMLKTIPGNTNPLHSNAAGKAILANLPAERRDSLIANMKLIPLTTNTITDSQMLRDELKQIREQGFSLNDQEHTENVRAVGGPVRYPNGDIAGALSISAPAKKLRGKEFREDIPDLVQGIANELEVSLRMSEEDIIY